MGVSMILAEKKSSTAVRKFNVGVVGASQTEINVITRVFSLTACRARRYDVVVLARPPGNTSDEIDFIMLCTANPTVIDAWKSNKSIHAAMSTPFVYLQRSEGVVFGAYQMSSPINPAKLIKLLDRYTIKELNFFPEFEIGHDSKSISDITMSGIRMKKVSSVDASYQKKRRSCALVVDDSLAVRKQMEIEFSMLDNDLDVAANGEEALTAVSEKKYDVIFLDVVMPGIDGYAACKKIKKNPKNKGVPVIMLTSRSSSFDKIKGALAGCDACLVKSINHKEFEGVYNKYVNRS